MFRNCKDLHITAKKKKNADLLAPKVKYYIIKIKTKI